MSVGYAGVIVVAREPLRFCRRFMMRLEIGGSAELFDDVLSEIQLIAQVVSKIPLPEFAYISSVRDHVATKELVKLVRKRVRRPRLRLKFVPRW